MKYFEDTWHVVDTFFKTTPYFLTKHHIESWNDFVSKRLLNTIKVLNPFTVLKEQDNNEIVHEIDVYIGGENGDNIFITKPTVFENGEQRILYPNEARLKDMTYQSDIYANITIKYTTYEKGNFLNSYTEELKQIKIGAIPIMLHSNLCILNNQPFEILREMGECPYDQGGYFIVDGKEKVIVAQERIALNRIFINESHDDKYSYEGLVRCTSEENPLFPKTIYLYVAKDVLTKKPARVRNSITMTCPNIETEVPLFVMFRALGIESDKEIMSYILYDINDNTNQPLIEFLRYSVLGASSIYTQKDAFEFLRKYVEYNNDDKVKHVLIHDVFPNVGSSFRAKAMFLGHVVNKLIKTCLGMIQKSDRDNYVFKRVDISGFLIGNLFRDYYNQFRNTVRNQIDREYLYGPWRTMKNIQNMIGKTNIHNIFRPKIIEDGFRKSLKGAWGRSMVEEQQDADSIKEGLVQDLARISYLGFLSHLRRVSTPMDPTSKIVAPHRLHPSQWGIMCPVESPDGGSIGLIKHLSILCNVTFDSSFDEILKVLMELGITPIEKIPLKSIHKLSKVLINNIWVGVHESPDVLYKTMKLLKRNAMINIYTSVAWDIIGMEINICTEAGRCCRPVYVVHDGKLLIEDYIDDVKNGKIIWNDLIHGRKKNTMNLSNLLKQTNHLQELIQNQAPIEYVDVEETNCSLIAIDATQVTSRHTHCEIHPSTIFSIVTQNIPLCNHNQAPRNIFFGAQGKQAVGTYATNFNHRIDTMAYLLHYPQKALVTTRYKEYAFNNVLTGGENLIVAIATFSGYNQEDSIIVNKRSIEKGMFNMTYFKSVIAKEEENKKEGEKIIFQNPLHLLEKGKEVQSMKFANYKKVLDENGIPKLNTYVKENDAIVGRSLVKTEVIDDIENSSSIFETKKKEEFYYDKSVIADKTLYGIVDKVVVYNDEDQKQTCKVRLRKIKAPELGDKMASCHGQKGVVGMILPTEDMPFTRDGIVPDIIINPHAFPTRMTIGHLMECILAKTCTYQGMTVDATPFNHHDYESIYSTLEDFGLDRYGNEIMYNGRSGLQIETEIFFGPTYYQRLKHMVSDKMNYRTTGPITVTTRQPTKGRGNNGGLRIGEMERDSILSHGIAAFLKESLMERSDIYEFEVENSSGDIALVDKKKNVFIPSSAENTHYHSVKTPYAFKLLLQEIKALGVKPILSVDGIEEDVIFEDFDTPFVEEDDQE